MKDNKDALKFTRMCKYWKANRCHLGAECSFAHSDLQLRDQPDLVATQLCYQFTRKGLCKNGESCKFAHGRSELRRVPKASKSDCQSPKPHKTLNAGQDLGYAKSPTTLPTSDVFGSVSMPTVMAPLDPAFSALGLRNFRPPPGLEGAWETSKAAGLPGPSMPTQPERVVKKLRNLRSFSQEALADMPLVLECPKPRKNRDLEGTESVASASTAWLSALPSESEPASPTIGSFWL